MLEIADVLLLAGLTVHCRLNAERPLGLSSMLVFLILVSPLPADAEKWLEKFSLNKSGTFFHPVFLLFFLLMY